MENNIDDIKINKTNNSKILKLFIVICILVLTFFFLFSSPFNNKDVIVHISPGESIIEVSKELKEKNVVRNDFILNYFIKLLKSGQGIITGDYLIKKNSPIWVVAWQIGRGHHNIEPIKVTIREGLSNKEISDLLSSKLVDFDKIIFLNISNEKQGYLFPDTYFLFPLDKADEIVIKLSANFENRIKKLKTEIKAEGKDLSEIIIMASILEGEAGGKNDISIISGILWKRILIGMPLQVDIDRLTYTNKGLPSKPLNNPGLASMEAALNPTDSPYLYYIHDKNGNVHYAKSFEEHKDNINLYLK
jgi:UPF0755 protein